MHHLSCSYSFSKAIVLLFAVLLVLTLPMFSLFKFPLSFSFFAPCKSFDAVRPCVLRLHKVAAAVVHYALRRLLERLALPPRIFHLSLHFAFDSTFAPLFDPLRWTLGPDSGILSYLCSNRPPAESSVMPCPERSHASLAMFSASLIIMASGFLGSARRCWCMPWTALPEFLLCHLPRARRQGTDVRPHKKSSVPYSSPRAACPSASMQLVL